jgi:RNA polymerase sigma-70 factor (ECF subfamily)
MSEFVNRSRFKRAVNLSQLPDGQLLERIAKRDVAAVEVFYARHAQAVLSLILRIVRDHAVAEELLQECFWQVWKSAQSYESSGAGAAWLFRIARNKALDHLRRIKVRPPIVAEEAESVLDAGGFAQNISSVELAVEQRWRAEQVRNGLARIPEEQRICLELAYFEGMSQSEIAEHLSLPLGTIKSRLRLGVEKMERYLLATGMETGMSQDLNRP